MIDLNQKENAYQSIKEMIVHGDLQMGQNVSDRLLSKKLNLGLTPIRDALNLLKSYRAGSIVVMNVKTGEILCMASTPAYDPNKIIQKPNKKYWESLLNNNLSPLSFRSIQGLYAPGSIFKVVTAYAGLDLGVITLKTEHVCKGVFSVKSG